MTAYERKLLIAVAHGVLRILQSMAVKGVNTTAEQSDIASAVWDLEKRQK